MVLNIVFVVTVCVIAGAAGAFMASQCVLHECGETMSQVQPVNTYAMTSEDHPNCTGVIYETKMPPRKYQWVSYNYLLESKAGWSPTKAAAEDAIIAWWEEGF